MEGSACNHFMKSAFQGFGEYAQAKKRKLIQQADERANHADSDLPLLFDGLIFYFDGFSGMEVSILDLKEQVVLRGAETRNYMDPEVTHMIAAQLTDAKMNKIRKPVVKPEWITDSIRSNRLLAWKDYLLYHTAHALQHTLHSSFKIPGSLSEIPSSMNEVSSDISLMVQDDLESNKLLTLPAYPMTAEPIENKISRRGNQYNLDERPDIDLQGEWIKKNSSTAPNFVKKYFESSRLHLISTLKSEMTDFVRLEMEKKTKMRLDRRKFGDEIIMHVDMDCFFASVAVRNRPELQNEAIAVAHSEGNLGKSTSEIASCNYKARLHGVTNGMLVGKAKTLCPELQVVGYDFQAYKDVSKTLYMILLDYANDIQAVSIDEAYINVTRYIANKTGFPAQETGLSPIENGGFYNCEKRISSNNAFSMAETRMFSDQERAETTELSLLPIQEITHLAEEIRQRIFHESGCTASVGVSVNMLLARLATKKAKPNGIFVLEKQEIATAMAKLPVSDLPGIGWTLSKKLKEMKLETCGQMHEMQLCLLQQQFGMQTGELLFNASRGIDTRVMQNPERQSIGAEINWGIRFENDIQVDAFIRDLSGEVHRRLVTANKAGRRMAVKVKKRREQKEAFKILGCGDCGDDQFSSNCND